MHYQVHSCWVNLPWLSAIVSLQHDQRHSGPFFVVKRSRTWTWRATSCGNLETLPQMECFLSAIVSVDIILIMWVN